MSLLNQIETYQPWNEQEAADREGLLARMRRGEDLYTRSNPEAHFTASAWVVSPDRKQVLMAYHNLYDSWAWLGGHADGQQDLPGGTGGERSHRGPSGYPGDLFSGDFNGGRP